MARTPHHVIAVVALGVAALLSACSDGDAEDATPRAHVTTTATTAPPTTASTTTKPITPEEQVKADYLEAVRAYFKRLTSPDPNDPTISRYHIGPDREFVISANRSMVEAGERDRVSPNGLPIPTVRDVRLTSPTTATLVACIVNDLVRYRASDGTVLDASVHSTLFRESLRLDGGRWKLDGGETITDWSDAKGCDR